MSQIGNVVLGLAERQTWMTLSCRPALMFSSLFSTSRMNWGCNSLGKSASVRLKKDMRHLRVAVTIAELPARPTFKRTILSLLRNKNYVLNCLLTCKVIFPKRWTIIETSSHLVNKYSIPSWSTSILLFTYLSRNIGVIFECKISLGKSNSVMWAVVVKMFTRGLKKNIMI